MNITSRPLLILYVRHCPLMSGKQRRLGGVCEESRVGLAKCRQRWVVGGWPFLPGTRTVEPSKWEATGEERKGWAVIIPTCIVPAWIINGSALCTNRWTNPTTYFTERMAGPLSVNHTQRRRFVSTSLSYQRCSRNFAAVAQPYADNLLAYDPVLELVLIGRISTTHRCYVRKGKVKMSEIQITTIH